MRRQGLVARVIKRRSGLTRQDKTKRPFPDLLCRDFTALGDTINLAHRLLENAGPGQIIISDDSLANMQQGSQIARPYVFQQRDPIKAKGRQQETVVYEVFRS